MSNTIRKASTGVAKASTDAAKAALTATGNVAKGVANSALTATGNVAKGALDTAGKTAVGVVDHAGKTVVTAAETAAIMAKVGQKVAENAALTANEVTKLAVVVPQLPAEALTSVRNAIRITSETADTVATAAKISKEVFEGMLGKVNQIVDLVDPAAKTASELAESVALATQMGKDVFKMGSQFTGTLSAVGSRIKDAQQMKALKAQRKREQLEGQHGIDLAELDAQQELKKRKANAQKQDFAIAKTLERKKELERSRKYKSLQQSKKLNEKLRKQNQKERELQQKERKEQLRSKIRGIVEKAREKLKEDGIEVFFDFDKPEYNKIMNLYFGKKISKGLIGTSYSTLKDHEIEAIRNEIYEKIDSEKKREAWAEIKRQITNFINETPTNNNNNMFGGARKSRKKNNRRKYTIKKSKRVKRKSKYSRKHKK